MGTNQRFHLSPQRFIENSISLLDKGVESGRITQDDRELIDKYIAETVAVSQIAASRRYKLVGILIRNRAYLPPYKECSIEDVYSAIVEIKTATKEGGKPRYTKNSISDHIQLLKRFFLWMSDRGHTTIPEKRLKEIKVPAFDRGTVTAEMILTESEVKAIIEAATTTRDRALIATLYEGGFRIGEIANMLWKDVKFTDWGVTINTSEKTGKMRYVALSSARAYLSQWKNDYPLQITDESYVFITTTTKLPLQYQGLVKQIRLLARRAGVKKYIKPHLFRHSRITHLIQQGASEAIVKMMMWGDVNTDMMKVYQHLTNADIDAEIAKLNGIEIYTDKVGKKKQAMKPIQCSRCATVNPPTAKYCINCGLPLSESEIQSVDALKMELDKSMVENPNFMMEIYTALQTIAQQRNEELPFGGNNKQ